MNQNPRKQDPDNTGNSGDFTNDADDGSDPGDRGDRDAGRTDRPHRVEPTGSEWENGPGVDVDDPNLSQVMAEAGAEDRKSELGKFDETNEDDEMRLDDPEQSDEGEEGHRGG